MVWDFYRVVPVPEHMVPDRDHVVKWIYHVLNPKEHVVKLKSDMVGRREDMVFTLKPHFFQKAGQKAAVGSEAGSRNGATKPLIPGSQHLHKDRVQPRTDDFHEGITAFHRQPECGQEDGREKSLVLPAVQFPLMFPKPDGMAEQRFGIADRPEVTDFRAA